MDRLDAAFSCACRADRHVEDASYHGSTEVPAQATATGSRLVIVVSNFGGLAVVTMDGPGTWTQAELTEVLHPDDASRTRRHSRTLATRSSPKSHYGVHTTGQAAGSSGSTRRRTRRPGGSDSSTTCDPSTATQARPAHRPEPASDHGRALREIGARSQNSRTKPLEFALHLRDQELSLRKIAARLVITTGKKKGQHPSPATVLRMLRDHDEKATMPAAAPAA